MKLANLCYCMKLFDTLVVQIFRQAKLSSQISVTASRFVSCRAGISVSSLSMSGDSPIQALSSTAIFRLCDFRPHKSLISKVNGSLGHSFMSEKLKFEFLILMLLTDRTTLQTGIFGLF